MQLESERKEKITAVGEIHLELSKQ
jgi:hypothetical protein